MMKIAYLDPYPVPDLRVASLQILQNVDAFARAGAHVTLVTPKGQYRDSDILGRAIHPNASLVSLRDIRRKWYFPFNSQKLFSLQITRWVKQNNVDALFTRNLKLACYLCENYPDIPLFFESHEIFAQSFAESHSFEKKKNRAKYHKLLKMEKLVYSQATGVFVLTSLLRDDIVSQYQVTTPITVVPDGVDLHAVADHQIVPPKLNQPITEVLYLGSLHKWKGIPTMMRAMKYLDNARLNIAGGTPEQIGGLTLLAQEMDVKDKVNFLGFIDPKKRFEAIAMHDICVLPLTLTSIGSRYTSPLKLFEYMAMEKPVVISDFPSIRDVVDEKAVSFADSGDAQSFAKQIIQLRENPQRAKEKTTHARSLVENYYNWDKRAETILKTIEKLIK
ncbi:glycosyltransferase family 4 protein [Proteus vulgaris]|uniref:glycosyltransferase family 4 protein n=1 Tax=Proteus vulgaris TaxID=585 RepID=UPI0018CE5AEE|nr:glycosyltransferase family 4 protein [Proteus vulgaris]QPN91397.1 glycosyltransferase family 4 protein [Proteus vulgaris]